MVVEGQLKENTNIKVKEPDLYKVVMFNDDFTPMDFVVEILITIFHKTYGDAIKTMMMVHKGNRAVVGRYAYDIAKTKVERAIKLARAEGYPFRVEVQK